jgi:hypothetical protein
MQWRIRGFMGTLAMAALLIGNPVLADCPTTSGVVSFGTAGNLDTGLVLNASKDDGSHYLIAHTRAGLGATGGAFGQLFLTSTHQSIASSDLDSQGSSVYFYDPSVAALHESGSYRWATGWRVSQGGSSTRFFYHRLFEQGLTPVNSEAKVTTRWHIFGQIAMDGAPSSSRYSVVTEEIVNGSGTVYCKVFDSNGTPMNEASLATWSGDVLDQPGVAVSGFWNSADKFVVVWTQVAASGRTVYAKIVNSSCVAITGTITVGTAYVPPGPSGTWFSPYIGVGAFSSGFVVAWIGRVLSHDRVFYRTFDSSGTPYINATEADAADVSGTHMGVRLTRASWAAPGGRPAPFFLLTWPRRTDVPGDDFHGRMRLFKNLFPPQAATDVQEVMDPLPSGTIGDAGFAPDFFTDCEDLRVGIAWIDLYTSHFQKRFFRFVPTLGLSMLGLKLGDTPSSTVEAPGLLWDNPKEPDLVAPESLMFE